MGGGKKKIKKTFIQNNAFCLTKKLGKEFFKTENINVMGWPRFKTNRKSLKYHYQ